MKELFITFLILSISLVSCVDKSADYERYNLTLKLAYDEDVPVSSYAGAKVVLSNQEKQYALNGVSNDSGYVSFSDLEPGFYSASVVHSFGLEGVAYFLNGLLSLELFSDLTDTVEVATSKTNALVIKQYYYSACLTPADNQYSDDQFVEIHNNSELLVYADGVSILEHESYSIEENYWTWLEDTIVARQIWTIPGDGDDVPIEPGKSIVIARDGINHQDEEFGNPLCPVNLENADFEFWVEAPTTDDIDAPNVPNMVENLFTYRGNDVAFHTRGGSAIAIALIPGTMEEKQEFIDNHQILKITSSDRYYGMVPNAYILDAVEATWDEDHAIYKRFPVELDAGYTYVEAGSRSGLCLRRKVAEVIDGRYVYQDTNNSSEDFYKGVVPKPWINEE